MQAQRTLDAAVATPMLGQGAKRSAADRLPPASTASWVDYKGAALGFDLVFDFDFDLRSYLNN